MPSSLQSLFSAIIEDNVALVKELLRSEPGLSQRSVIEESYQAGIAHWIYIGDTALHITAAGYRVEIAKLLLAAGANPSADQQQIIEMFLEHGINPDLKDANGKSVREWIGQLLAHQ